jgi:UDP:flavonoid glycosyltransferase YjiC (YdhE family)
MASLLNQYGIKVEGSNAFDMLIRKSTLLLQSGVPGFEYYRSDLGKNVRFIGALLPYNSKNKTHSWYNEKLKRYSRVLLVTQGTVEKDTSKLLVPTLEAFKNSDYLLVATTGGSGTKELQEKYAHDNIIVEDFIPFSEVMPYADVYITNGGYGGVMLSIENKLPMVVAGVHEGKSEINARVEYFRLGINLGTEKPNPSEIRKGVEKVLNDVTYQNSVDKLSKEFSNYNPNELCTFYINQVLNKENRVKVF